MLIKMWWVEMNIFTRCYDTINNTKLQHVSCLND